MTRLTENQIENLAVEIRGFLIEEEMWADVNIYFNGRCFTTRDSNGVYHYNDSDCLIVLEDEDPEEYFDYIASDHILSMSFEGELYEIINYPNQETQPLLERFNYIFEKNGLYYELGDAWNLTCYYI